MLLTLLPQNICKTCEWYSVHFWFQTLSSFSLLEKGPIFSPLHSVYPNDWYLSLVAQTVKASAYNVGDPGSIPRSGRSPGERNGYPLQYSCLGNPMDRGAWWATYSHGVTKSWTRLSDLTFLFLEFTENFRCCPFVPGYLSVSSLLTDFCTNLFSPLLNACC